MNGSFRTEKVVTTGEFSIDGQTWEVSNNVWIVGDDQEVVVVDAAHETAAIIDAVGDRNVVAVLCTHGHNDHITVAPELGVELCAPVLLHPADAVLWKATHPEASFWSVESHPRIGVAGTEVEVIHTPGHSHGSTCFYVPEAGQLFSGDTLFAGGPGATGRSYSDFPTIIGSIRDRLFSLPTNTRVNTGHGEGTTIGAESPYLEEWIARGH
ncbi:MBL fold metallo-hydrolase [Mycolicibacterium stellerae]|uniref:MBL fold metallo-hydrolase n=1 Tax=Mycolicibacterium stellerae TaxID=2358193 RepID=UPI000F0BC6BC|nr:MBL fold metallo-hydrolase [Mycolicibacterium stellerae]